MRMLNQQILLSVSQSLNSLVEEVYFTFEAKSCDI